MFPAKSKASKAKEVGKDDVEANKIIVLDKTCIRYLYSFYKDIKKGTLSRIPKVEKYFNLRELLRKERKLKADENLKLKSV